MLVRGGGGGYKGNTCMVEKRGDGANPVWYRRGGRGKMTEKNPTKTATNRDRKTKANKQINQPETTRNTLY